MDELLTVREAAAAVKVHPNTMRRWMSQGKVKCETFGYKTKRVRASELMRHRESQKGVGA